MKITVNKSPNLYSGPLGFLAQIIVLTLAAILATRILPGVTITSTGAAIITATVIAVLNTFLRPVLIVLTLPFTIFSMGLFLFIINAVIILLASSLLPFFHVNSFWDALLFSLLLIILNYLLELPNRLMRRPDYQPSDNSSQDPHTDTDENGFSSYEIIEEDENEE